MKEITKRKVFLPLLALIFLLFFLLPFADIEARQGCCSWHGGVCGCRCCDGTPLSAKCAPYYPQCGSKPIPTYESPKQETPKPQYNSPAPKSFTGEIPKENGGGSILWWIIGAGIVGYVFYRIGKRLKNK